MNNFQKIYKIILQANSQNNVTTDDLDKIYNKYQDIIINKVPDNNQQKCSEEIIKLTDKARVKYDNFFNLLEDKCTEIIKKYLNNSSKKEQSTSNNIQEQFDINGEKVYLSQIQWNNTLYYMFQKQERMHGNRSIATKHGKMTCQQAFLKFIGKNKASVSGFRQIPRKFQTLKPQNNKYIIISYGIKKEIADKLKAS